MEIKLKTTTTAVETIKQMENISEHLGYPLLIIIDNGPPYTNTQIKGWCHQHNIPLYHSPSWHPQSNKLAERAGQDAKVLPKRISRDEMQSNWNNFIDKSQQSIRFANTKN